MRQEFRNTLLQYNDAVVQDHELHRKATTKRHQLQRDVDKSLRNVAYETQTPVKAQSEIFDIQKKKQAIMRELLGQLRRIDRGEQAMERVSKDARYIFQEGEALYWRQANGTNTPVTLGDLVTDQAWGIEYELDPYTASRQAQKDVVIARSKQKLQDLLDEQIKVHESSTTNNDEGLQGAFSRSLDHSRHPERGPSFGLVAEKILMQLAKKWVIDDNLGFKIEAGDAYEDIRQKIDFFIQRRRDARLRGVKVEPAKGLQNKAIQFTINTDPDVLEQKRVQVYHSRRHLRRDKHRRIDDLMLVTFRSEAIGAAYDEWLEQGRPPGGPANLFSEDVQRQLFDKLMEGLMDQEEADRFWEQAA